MKLLYKPDWEEAKQHYLAWWAGEALDRCMLFVTAPREDIEPSEPPKAPEDPVRRWTDMDYIARRNQYRHSHTFYGGEAFPIWIVGYPGHTSIPTFLGCPITLDHETGWHTPILNGDDWDVRGLKIDKEGYWWKFTLASLQKAVDESCGRSIPSVGAFGGCGDTLAALRGNDKLLYDVSDRPELVRDAELYLMDMWIEVYRTFHDIIREAAEGSTCWFPLWSPGRFYAAQCDFSYMISPGMFRDIFMPAVEKQVEFLDYSVYHVDGVEAFRHIPAICELPKLQAVQVLPGAGKPSPLHYMEHLKTVQAAGKNLHIDLPADEVKQALASLSARGLCIGTQCKTEAEAKRLLDDAKKWSRDRKT